MKMTNISKIREHLFSRTGKGIKYELSRVKSASQLCGDAHVHFKSIHVAGTNGKGSTCAYLESMIRAQGYSTGLFTSPHLINFEERFIINGKIVTEKMWSDVYFDLQSVIDSFNLTFFEATTLIAFELFKRHRVQWAVIETGLGGRLDATNIIIPEVAVITSINLDHQEYLGDTIEQIAEEKFGIIKRHVPTVIAAHSNHTIMNLVKEICAEKRSDLTIVSDNQHKDDNEGTWLSISDNNSQAYEIMDRQSFQSINCLVAVNAFQAAGFTVDADAVNGLKNTRIPGRMQEFNCQGKKVLFDVGHNSQAASILIKELSLRFDKKSICIITGIMSDKNYQSMLKCYSLIASRIIITKPDIPRAATTEMLQSCMLNKNNVSIVDRVSDACMKALDGEEAVICITGSFHTVGEAFIALNLDPFTMP